MKDTNNIVIKNRVRVIYKPTAGRAKVKTCTLNGSSMVTINKGTHTVGESSVFPYKGKLPWCIIHQGQTAAINIAGGQDVLGPQFLNEAVSNHYASDVLNSMEEFGKKHTTEVVLIVMLGITMLLSVIFGIWAIAKMGSLQDQVAALYLSLHPAAPAAAAAANGVHDSVVQHA